MEGYWLNDTHWVEYNPTLEPEAPPSKRRRREEPKQHATGCARTEGFYKLDSKEKAKHKSHYARCVSDAARLNETSTVTIIFFIFKLVRLVRVLVPFPPNIYDVEVFSYQIFLFNILYHDIIIT